MSNRIEIEAKYFCRDEEGLRTILQEEKMKESETIEEIDEYFTDINSEYIRNRTCLRIRRNSQNKMELTFKGKSNIFDNTYAKKESNIKIDVTEYKGLIEFLSNIGYYSYVEVNKKRKIYTKNEKDLIYNVMIDKVKDVGDFVEFEILCNNENTSIEILKEKLYKFVEKFEKLKMTVADLPYRDFVAKELCENIVKGEKKDTLIVNLDDLLIDSESGNRQVNDNKNVLLNIKLLKMLKEKGIKICGIFATNRKDIENLIKKLDLHYIFDFMISKEDILTLNDNDELFKNKYKLDKERCIIVENMEFFSKLALLLLNNYTKIAM